jgi:hypothetical protein
MKEVRFSLIMRYFHFMDNEKAEENDLSPKKLKKIWSIHQKVIENFQIT